MKFIIENIWLIVLAVGSGGLLLWQTLQKSQGGAISSAEAVRLINREKAVLVDVSEPAEFAAGHANGARNVPMGKLDGAKELPSNKALPLVLMCTTGARAARAAAQLRKAGHEKAVSVAGGLKAWREAGLPIEKSA
ncbi:rhodanese-like domain-containing protein [Aquabacterium sp.]|uniref:rhodanese-like domain-containing protein n=1 Tax=Aquabacterium sp. TaxID=1872578 RepID=UPI003784F536